MSFPCKLQRHLYVTGWSLTILKFSNKRDENKYNVSANITRIK